MVSLMTYNLGIDSKDHVSSATNIIKSEAPDILVLNELSWLNRDSHTLEQLSAKLDLPYFIFAESTKSVNHVALFSKFRLKNATVVHGLRNAGIIAIAETEFGDISVAGVHLAPNTEDTRLVEITNIISRQKNYHRKVIMGDLNSISPENIVKNWNLSGVPKQPYQHEVIERIKKAGYLDAAVITQKEQIHTVPVTQDSDVVYHDLRLDYVFLSNSLAERTVDYRVIINEITRVCSDHYPIIAYIQ